jgi:hypothetical protein
VRLEGSLDAFSLPDIFSLLSMTKKTGGLHLRRADAHGAVWLCDGLVTGGASDLNRLSLGRRLAGTERVAEDALVAAVAAAEQDGNRAVARHLADAQAIDEGDLHALVCEHIVDTVFDLMRWPDGAFEFVADEANADDVGVRRELDEVVTEARRRLDAFAAIDPRVTSPESVMSVALDAVSASEISADEWALLALVDGRRTVGDLVTIGGRGEYAVMVALADLVGRGILRADDGDGVAALIRRQDLIGTLESPALKPPDDESLPTAGSAATALRSVATDTAVADTEPTSIASQVTAAESLDAAESRADLPSADGDIDDDAAGADDDLNDLDVDVPMAEVTEIPRSTGARRDLTSVTPQRPEPFRPGREPDHPEPLAAAMAGGGSVVAATPAAAIERDPSVNKSLLLRLIAGVRGL